MLALLAWLLPSSNNAIDHVLNYYIGHPNVAEFNAVTGQAVQPGLLPPGTGLIDALDLALYANHSHASSFLEYASSYRIGADASISTFETFIRIVGGLLGAFDLTCDRRLVDAAVSVAGKPNCFRTAPLSGHFCSTLVFPRGTRASICKWAHSVSQSKSCKGKRRKHAVVSKRMYDACRCWHHLLRAGLAGQEKRYPKVLGQGTPDCHDARCPYQCSHRHRPTMQLGQEPARRRKRLVV